MGIAARASTRMADVCSPVASCLQFPAPRPTAEQPLQTQPSSAHIPDRCLILASSSGARSLVPTASCIEGPAHGSVSLRSPGKVYRAQTNFAAFQQPCYGTSLKPRATIDKLTKGRAHYSFTWTYITPPESQRASDWLAVTSSSSAPQLTGSFFVKE
jgi:hypothetical protein